MDKSLPDFLPSSKLAGETQEKACSEVFSRRLMRLGTNEVDPLIKTNSLDESRIFWNVGFGNFSSKNVKVEV